MATVGAKHASILIDDGVLSAIRADLACDFGSVGDVFLQRPDNTVFPSVDIVFFDGEVLH